MTEPSKLPSSFRDPSGFLFRRNGVLYRQVNPVHASDYDALYSSGLYEALTEEGLLIPHEEVPARAVGAEGAYKVVKPEIVDFISYPYEWSFGELKDAALATLAIQKIALEKGMSLRDASAYNIQFHRGRPVLIDTLSFEQLEEGAPWIAYRQFCQHFLAPLALMSYRHSALGQLSRIHIDGVPLDEAVVLLPFRARFRMPLLLHLYLHARSQKRHGSKGTPAGEAKTAPKRSFTLQAFRGVIESLRGAVARMEPAKGDSHWIDYYAEASHYSSTSAEHKRELVATLLEQARPASVWDLGANTGAFSRIASEKGIKTVAFEMDAQAVDEAYRKMKTDGDQNLLPLICDLTNPSPGLGWAGAERMPLAERGPADVLLALALIHHLAIANNVPLGNVAEYFASLGRRLIIEFVPKTDEKVQHLLSSREDIFPTYTREGFEEAFKERFETERVEEIKGSERVLYLMRAR
ncbi:MAG: SAM-dependent methyltransferase [Actinobacteria bacterium]|nr:SAM-dependent methyltransferase [Actinomycetota bacterium]